MITQIRPNRLEISDRFPLLSFTVHNEEGPRVAEIVLATDATLFENPEGRTSANFFSSRELGLLSLPVGQAVYTVPPQILQRFADANRLWFGLATADVATGSNWEIDVTPNDSSPYISLVGLSNKAMGRVRMFPTRSRINSSHAAQPAQARMEWAGDTTQPGTSPAIQPNGQNNGPAADAAPMAPAPNGSAAPNGATPPSGVPYDDGFGPLPALDRDPVTNAGEPLPKDQMAGNGGNDTAIINGSESIEPVITAASLGKNTDYRVSDDREPVQTPSVREATLFERGAIKALLLIPGPGQTFALTLALAKAQGLSVAIGGAVSGGLIGGGSLGAGIIFAPNGDIGIYGLVEVDFGFIFSGSATIQVTILNGGISAFTGISFVATISAGEVVVAGATAIFDTSFNWIGVTLEVGIGVGSPVSVYVGVQGSLSMGLGAGTAVALGKGNDRIEIKYRMFIPSPAIKGPWLSDFGGDGRGFSYAGGTARGEIVAHVDVTPGGGIANVSTVSRHWGESTAYDGDDTFEVSGKPDWWLGKRSGANPKERETLPVTDDNLRIYTGAPATTRNITGFLENASVVTIHAAGHNPLITPSPDIDVSASVLIRRNSSGAVEVRAMGKHDGFPAHELYVNRQRIHHYDPVAHDNGPSALVGYGDREFSTSWTTVPALTSSSGHAVDPASFGLGKGVQKYTVASGDNLSRIADKYGISRQALEAANSQLADPGALSIGQELNLPAGVSAALPAPAAQPNPLGAGQINIDDFLDASQGSAAPAAKVIGHAEGTRNADGTNTAAYDGHSDPGNNRSNKGSFSYQGAADQTPDQADRAQLTKLAGRINQFKSAAARVGIDPYNAKLVAVYFDQFTQGEVAAGRFLDQLDYLATNGISDTTLNELRFRSYVDHSTGVRFPGSGGGFENVARTNLGREPTEEEIQAVIRADQETPYGRADSGHASPELAGRSGPGSVQWPDTARAGRGELHD